MPESLLSDLTEGGERQQLVARNTDIHSRPCVLNGGAVYPRGCLVYAATTAADFVKVNNGAIPAATDIIGIVSEEVDATDGDTKGNIYTAGEFYRDTVFKASLDTIEVADVLLIEEACVHQNINLVKGAYDTFVAAADTP